MPLDRADLGKERPPLGEEDAQLLLLLEQLLQQGQWEKIVAVLHHVLANYPVSRFLEALSSAPDLRAELAKLLVPPTYSGSSEHLKATVPYSIAHPMDSMGSEAAFRFSLLATKDPSTARHCLDTAGAVTSMGWALEHAGAEFHGFTSVQKEMQLAATTHDIGKAEMAAIFLLAPFNRDRHLPEIFRANLVDSARTRPIRGMESVLGERFAEFAELFETRRGRPPLDSARVDELMSTLKELSFPFHTIPIRYLMKVMRDMGADGTFPTYVEKLAGDRIIDPDFLQQLSLHQHSLTRLQRILERYGVDGWELTFADIIARHEADSVLLLNGHVEDCVARWAGAHHRYPATPARLKTPLGEFVQSNGLWQPALGLLPAADVATAMAQKGRVYRRTSGAQQLTTDWRAELARRGLAPEAMLSFLAPFLEKGNAPAGEVMARFHENIVTAFGNPPVPNA